MLFVRLGTPSICRLLQKPSRKFEDLEQRTIALSCEGFDELHRKFNTEREALLR
jgi:hypothetical protein